MATYGVTPQGFLKKPLATSEAEVDSDLQGILGASAGTEPDGTIPLRSKAGQLKALIVDREAGYWDLLEGVFAALDPSSADDAAQDVVASITGSLREEERFSTVVATCTGTPLTVLSAARVATVQDTGAKFDSLADGTIVALSAWAAGHGYSVADRITNGGNCYICTTAGTSAGSGGPSGTSTGIVDNTVVWNFLGVGTGAVDIAFQAEVVGPIGALAGKLNQISTPINGWKTITNLLDAAVGNDVEDNSDFRARRDEELATKGNTTPDAIRANILAVNQDSNDSLHQAPTACTVFFNRTDYTDANGVPPHTVEIMVQNGTDQDITQAVWDSVGSGTRTVGNTSGTATDSEGQPQLVYWSRPTPVPIYVVATGKYDASKWPASSDAVVAQAMLSAFLTGTENWPIALDVRVSPLNGMIMRGPSETNASGVAVVPADPSSDSVAGLLEVDTLFIGLSPAPASSAQIAITTRQIATFDSTRCTFTASAEDP